MSNVLPFQPPIVLSEGDERYVLIGEVREQVLELNLLQLRYVVGFLMDERLEELIEALDAARDAFASW